MSFRQGTYYESKVRETINRLAFPGLEDDLPEEVDDHPTRTVTSRFILKALNDAQQQIVSSAKAYHIPLLINQFEGTSSEFNLLLNVDRILHGRVWRQTVDTCSDRNNATGWIRCRYRDVGEHQLLETSGRIASECFPAYTWNDNILRVYPTDGLIRVDYVAYPEQMDNLTDTLQIDHRFDGALVAYVTAQAFKQLGEVHDHNLYMSIFDRRLHNFSRDFRIGPAIKGRLGSIHLDEEMELE